MSEQIIGQICEKCGNDRTRLMDIVTAVQKELGCVSSESMNLIASKVGCKRVEVEGVISFYAFLSKEPKGKTVVRVCNDVVDKMKGASDVLAAFAETLGIEAGQTTSDGNVTLENTPCIGMCDQAPAVLINDVVVTNLTIDKVKEIAASLKSDPDVSKLSLGVGDGNNAADLVNSMVNNNILKAGEVILGDNTPDAGLKAALEKSPDEVIKEVKDSKLRGRGGAGFPTGMKWEFTRAAEGDKKYVLCNADEGEPGTFKDRVLLTEKFDLVFEGMTIAGYAIGSDSGVLYLRAEYAYLRALLEKALEDRRSSNLLGNNICGKEGFNFDIRIQTGAGAYICGEESALISSCEGLRGDPKTRPPFPAQKGYMASPTTVNNVETFCGVARIMDKGAAWFAGIGSGNSAGTKVLSVSGDCANPGILEVPFGTKIQEILKDVGAKDTQAVLVGGPSGQFIAKDGFSRAICFDDLATGGSIVVFDKTRDMLHVADEYMEFFVEESCGFCTPCRAGNVLIKNCLENIMAGKGQPGDLEYLEDLGKTIKATSRCGLGQTSPNPVLTTIKSFRKQYESKLKKDKEGYQPSFNIKAALSAAEEVQGRKSVIY